jgi:hypothetical protein
MRSWIAPASCEGQRGTLSSCGLSFFGHSRMQATLEWMTLTYEARFSAPSFDLPSRSTLILKSFYEEINPRYAIRPGDMQVMGGNTLSDVRTRITLFGGNGTLDITVDKLLCFFSNLRSKSDLTICKDCISLSEQAIRSSLPDASVQAVAINPALVLQLGGGEENATNHLSRVVGKSIGPKLGAIGNIVQHPGVSWGIENVDEGWQATFRANRDPTRVSSLFVFCDSLYKQDSAIAGLEDRAQHVEYLLSRFLESIELKVA